MGMKAVAVKRDVDIFNPTFVERSSVDLQKLLRVRQRRRL